MAHIAPVPRSELTEFESFFAAAESAMGFVPNSLPTMGHRPEILRGFAALGTAVLRGGTVPPGLKQLVALMASMASGCRYCQAHTSSTAARAGVSTGKVEAVYEFETSPEFTAAERAALRLARDAAIVPNATTPAHFAELRRHFDDGEIVEIVATISLFGWLNRWNDTMATQLEAEPLEFASTHLAVTGWEAGKHNAGSSNVTTGRQ
jgi:uncharacterized peroxidase-related enzyme